MATMGAALAAFDKMLDDVATWATGGTQAHEQVEQGGRVLRREYDIVAACEALKVARRAIDGDGDEQAAADGLMGVVRAAQWHEIDTKLARN